MPACVTTPKLTEAEFTSQVIALAKLRGWRVMHQRPARTKDGWRTAIQGHAGFPDLVLVRNGKCIVAELKVGANRTTQEQDLWLAVFCHVPGVSVYVWYPDWWDEIERILA